jgi:predicted dehydrogenase
VTSPLRIGIAGYGIVGKRRRKVADQRDDMKVVAVCDQYFDDSGELDDGVRYYPHYDDLLNEDLDALFVSISNDMAAEVTIAGLEHGLHVFCEKPPGRDLDDIARVKEVARQRPAQKLKYGFNHRYHDSVRKSLDLLASGELGRVINMKGVYGKSQLVTFGQTSWRTDRALAGGGVLLDQGIHMVDLIRLFGGEFADVHSFISNDFWKHDVEDNAYALMRSDSGIVAMLHSSATQWRHRFNLDITLEKGSIVLSGILSGSKSYGAETLTVARAGNDDMGDPLEQTTRYNSDPSWAAEVDEFAAAIANDMPIEHGSVDDAYKTMELVYRIYIADAEWRDRWKLTAVPSSASPTKENEK